MLKKSLMVLAVILAIPVVWFVAKYEYTIVFGSEFTENRELNTLAAGSDDARKAVRANQRKKHGAEIAILDNETVKTQDAIREVELKTNDLKNRQVHYVACTVLEEAQLRNVDGTWVKDQKKLEVGQPVRLLPLEGVKTFKGESKKLYVSVMIAPYGDVDAYWVVQEAVPRVEEMMKQSKLVWEQLPPEGKTYASWAIQLAPGQESPKLHFSAQPNGKYQIQIATAEEVSWKLNGGEWQLLSSSPFPHLKGPNQVQFRVSSMAGATELVVFKQIAE